ncbi:bifunctional hydroxymethylpyrimidine kinase/phosphomethylpyrimidine kinase [Bordetella trematum]|uniref:bifunctional hydroxymethylpyrimidine kinase/phosphomethylpyrimidine kinase n=1 Tax=Bordetella trematum TaxID=123899 RepID=UPI000D87CF47|nr:bifunctional hydroxymethylpyrimidine kinase/phosphomethylpyrimidine kinase [Bordetella trematum]SPU49099.1 phosphomethylpyrimidine kinase [Bordetella trematum]VDH04190.1 Hydroxymethylpyrimidine/phosphomethylpyrimidine kinase [Bordetella trematum]
MSQNAERPIPNVLSIAGLDPSGGAGILADIKAISALGAYGCGVAAALTAQNTQGVTGVLPVDPAFVGRQIDTLFEDVPIAAVKIGMLGQQPVIQVVGEKLARWRASHVVLDPVMVSSSGELLLERGAIGMLREALLPQVTVLTPNLPEAGVLLDARPVETLKEMRRVAEKLRERMAYDGHRWVLLKGGHLPGEETIDLLHDGDRMLELPGRRIATTNNHGTGCTLSAALAALIPQTGDVPEAARRAKHYLTEALRHADRLQAGKGHGPLHHFHAWW